MITTPYCYDKSELDNEKEYCDVNDVVEENKKGDLINQIIRPPLLEFENASGFGYMMSFDWILSH